MSKYYLADEIAVAVEKDEKTKKEEKNKDDLRLVGMEIYRNKSTISDLLDFINGIGNVLGIDLSDKTDLNLVRISDKSYYLKMVIHGLTKEQAKIIFNISKERRDLIAGAGIGEDDA